MIRSKLAALAIAASVMAVPAHATLVADYELDNSLAEAGGGAPITNNGAVLGATGLTFAANAGPTLGGFASTGVYSVALAFSVDATSGYRKILDFKGLTSDTGLYVYNGVLSFYNVAASTATVFSPGVSAQVVLTRDAAGLTTGYVDGAQFLQFSDTSGIAVIDSELNFFRDDFPTGNREASSGFVDYIRVYDTALTAAQVAALSAAPGVPEPATWALMIAGLGLVGTALRRKRVDATA